MSGRALLGFLSRAKSVQNKLTTGYRALPDLRSVVLAGKLLLRHPWERAVVKQFTHYGSAIRDATARPIVSPLYCYLFFFIERGRSLYSNGTRQVLAVVGRQSGEPVKLCGQVPTHKYRYEETSQTPITIWSEYLSLNEGRPRTGLA